MLVPYGKMKSIADDQEGRVEPKRKYLFGYVIEDWKEQVEEQKEPWPGMQDFLKKRLREVREMFDVGVRIMPGTDTAVVLIWPAFSLHDELRLLVDIEGLIFRSLRSNRSVPLGDVAWSHRTFWRSASCASRESSPGEQSGRLVRGPFVPAACRFRRGQSVRDQRGGGDL